MRHDLPIVAVQRKGHMHDLCVPAPNDQGVTTPSLVDSIANDPTPVRATAPTMHHRKAQPIHLHHPPYALAIVSRPEKPIHPRRYPTMAIRRSGSKDHPDLP
jgi:hypothetical protein